jgi:hypothetical protein
LMPSFISRRQLPQLFLSDGDLDDAILSSQNRSTTKQHPFDLERLRGQFEALIVTTDDTNDAKSYAQNSTTSSVKSSHIPSSFRSTLLKLSLWSSSDHISLHEPPPLTSLERERRVLEIQLLERLLENDDIVLDHLWSLWYSERGRKAAQRLNDATLLSNSPSTWKEAESILRGLISEYGIYWVEPVNRLATLFYIQEKYQQSIDLCHIILYVKPWHFGALSGIVALYGQVNNAEQARIWSERRLPTFLPISNQHNNPRRKEWVQNAVSQAQESLREAEDRLRQSFGARDAKQMRGPNQDGFVGEDADPESWQ